MVVAVVVELVSVVCSSNMSYRLMNMHNTARCCKLLSDQPTAPQNGPQTTSRNPKITPRRLQIARCSTKMTSKTTGIPSIPEMVSQGLVVVVVAVVPAVAAVADVAVAAVAVAAVAVVAIVFAVNAAAMFDVCIDVFASVDGPVPLGCRAFVFNDRNYIYGYIQLPAQRSEDTTKARHLYVFNDRKQEGHIMSTLGKSRTKRTTHTHTHTHVHRRMAVGCHSCHARGSQALLFFISSVSSAKVFVCAKVAE